VSTATLLQQREYSNIITAMGVEQYDYSKVSTATLLQQSEYSNIITLM
jgi:hypothetical protein